jgi:acetyl esterase/lipase
MAECPDLEAASQKPSHESYPPLLNPKLSLARRTRYFLQLWSLKIASAAGLSLVRLFKPIPAEFRPTHIKAYSCRPHLRNRIFIPRSHKPGQLLPLYLSSHGGGHALLSAQFDDHFCSTFANKFNILVVSIEYSLAPRSKFPGPTNDVVDIAQAVIKDGNLPIDKERVVLGGFSTGGNLSLSASQMPVLRGMIKGIVAWYPVTDFSLSPAEKQASRLYRNSRDFDDLKDWGPIWDCAYVPLGHDLKDPLLSPRYTKRERLPKWVFVVGAEFDMLVKEAREMVFDVAGADKIEREEGREGFEKEGYRWTLVRDVRHGFTYDLMDGKGREAKDLDRKRTEETMEQVGEWLFKGPFAE